MLFKLTNRNSDRTTHCGVLEFVADEGICYLPHWVSGTSLPLEGGPIWGLGPHSWELAADATPPTLPADSQRLAETSCCRD